MTVAEAVDVPYEQLETFIGKTGCFSMMFDFMYSNLDITKNEEWFPDCIVRKNGTAVPD